MALKYIVEEPPLCMRVKGFSSISLSFREKNFEVPRAVEYSAHGCFKSEMEEEEISSGGVSVNKLLFCIKVSQYLNAFVTSPLNLSSNSILSKLSSTQYRFDRSLLGT
ncbi:uncharacterized protein LOC112589867 [Harpegnathos saltator]|uniref:uncharacterized protein LOC112589867 n=1 Tax=Harpegnathos saltator TaxID=610380 RepID=UPI000DBEE0B7|nr:uncharacterized protein LOC112589867 [Harpegnathos saltator]